jgi:ABC-type branched-subunit amino acid transport system permease subunit
MNRKRNREEQDVFWVLVIWPLVLVLLGAQDVLMTIQVLIVALFAMSLNMILGQPVCLPSAAAFCRGGYTRSLCGRLKAIIQMAAPLAAAFLP